MYRFFDVTLSNENVGIECSVTTYCTTVNKKNTLSPYANGVTFSDVPSVTRDFLDCRGGIWRHPNERQNKETFLVYVWVCKDMGRGHYECRNVTTYCQREGHWTLLQRHHTSSNSCVVCVPCWSSRTKTLMLLAGILTDYLQLNITRMQSQRDMYQTM